MFKKMKLRHRILLGYLAPLALLLGVMGLVFYNLQQASYAATEVEASHWTIDEANELIYILTKIERAARGYLLMKNSTSRKTFLENEQAFISRGEKLSGLVKEPRQQENLRNMLKKGQDLIKLNKQILALVDQGQKAQALALFSNRKNVENSTELDAQWALFREQESEQVKQLEEAQDSAMRRVAHSIIYGMLSAIALAVAIALWLTASISRNITINASHLSSATNQIATTITELSTSSRQSSEQAANTAAAAERASTATLQGGETTRQTVEAMDKLKGSIAAMAEQILHLSEQTEQIGGIATLVKDLSGQINMLALNAAVEAARAGEHGKGFAVVASEVRKLADQSKKSAEMATALVADIQKASNASIMMTEESSHTVAAVMRHAQKVSELFTTLSGMASSVNENSQQVMLNAQQQSAAFGQVVEATNSIATGARENLEGIA
jgi:methyl-accepting chemotaxis protein